MSDKPEVKAPVQKVQKDEKNEQVKAPKKAGEGKTFDNKGGERQQPYRNRQNYGGQKYPKKSGENDNEETKQDKKKEDKDNNENKEQGEKMERKKKPYKERVMVTLETVVPEMPKKHEKLAEPDTKVYDAEYEKLQKEIDATYLKMVSFLLIIAS